MPSVKHENYALENPSFIFAPNLVSNSSFFKKKG